MALFHMDLLFALRPRWFDLPIVTYCCFCPIASSLSNGLGFYDGCSGALTNCVTLGLPYLFGRVYFTRLEHLRELAVGIVVGGMIYVPLCWWELKMSPQLHRQLYGFMSGGWGEIVLWWLPPQGLLEQRSRTGFVDDRDGNDGFLALGQRFGESIQWLLVRMDRVYAHRHRHPVQDRREP